MKLRIAAAAALFGCLCVRAGEIVIIQPAPQSGRSEREPSRSERELGRTMDKARQQAGRGGATVIIDDGESRALEKAEQSIREAQNHLRSGGEAPGTDGTTIILRAAPLSETERLRQKARAQLAPANAGRNAPCTETANTVGIIGDGSHADRSNVVEKGNSAVNSQCK